MKLTDEQKQLVTEIYNGGETDLNAITKICFNDDDLDGRHKEGRAVRDFLQSLGFEYEVISHKKVPDIKLTAGQKEFIEEQAAEGLNSFNITRILFPHIENLTPLHKATKTVLNYIREIDADNQINKEVNKDYSPPQAISRILKKINDADHRNLTEESLTKKEHMLVENLGKNLNDKRFVMNMNQIKNVDERDLFESQFVKYTWNKEDLTSEEVTLYLDLCKDILNLEVCSRHIESLKEMFEAATSSDKEDSRQVSMSLSDAIKTKEDSYHKIETRITQKIQRLNGDREKRMKERAQGSSSVLSLVEAFQNEESREHMVRMAEAERKAAKKEINRIESMAEFKARVLGIKKHDAV